MSRKHIKAASIFQGLSDEHLAAFEAIGKTQMVERWTRIFNEGDPARNLYIVGTGRVALEVALERPDGSHTPRTTVASLGPGDAFGISALVEPHVLTMSAYAVEPSELLLFEGHKLRDILEGNKAVGYVVMRNLAQVLEKRLAGAREAFVYDRALLRRQMSDS
ncbi:MAG: Crp/Fnr family transcriptional regulator [Chloroflexi bacterium]|nr:Crp/Fnr family transcriptional regulator [Chloroflexota bacterium]